MPEQNFSQLISETVCTVLETMFFTVPLGYAESKAHPGDMEARLAFHGHPSGALDVCLSRPGARMLAGGFLGEEDETLTDIQLGQVTCELANMLCGSLVSKLEPEESFNLDPPELVPVRTEDSSERESSFTSRQSFELESGVLTVSLCLEAET